MTENDVNQICDYLDMLALDQHYESEKETKLIMDAIDIIREWQEVNKGKDNEDKPSPYAPFRVICLPDGRWSVKCSNNALQGYIITRECRFSYDDKFLAEKAAAACKYFYEHILNDGK